MFSFYRTMYECGGQPSSAKIWGHSDHGKKSYGRLYILGLFVVSIFGINSFLECDLTFSNHVCMRWPAFHRQNMGSFWPRGKKLGSFIYFGAIRCQFFQNTHTARTWPHSIEPCMHAVVHLPPPKYGVILTTGKKGGVVYMFWGYPLSAVAE